MKHPKQFYCDLVLPKFWFWAYFENGFHYFQKYNYLTLPANEKYLLVKCKEEEDIANENYLYFTNKGYSR